MKTLLCAMALLGVLGAGNVAAVASGAPRIAVETQDFNFGRIWQGEKLDHVFGIRNDGSAPLVIGQVRTSCGCTVALLSDRQLAPGASAQVRVTFDSSRFYGPVVKTIYLFSNDPLRRVTQLYLRGTVRPEVRFEPPRLDLGSLPPAEPTVVRVQVVNQGDRELIFDYLQRTLSEVKATLSRRRLAPGQSAELTVTIIPRKGQRRLDGSILLRAEGLRIPELTLPLHASVGPASPPR